MNFELFDPGEGFALVSDAQFIPPSSKARLEALFVEVAGQPPPPPLAPAPRKVFRLSAAELAKIERNMARLSKFSDQTAGMF